MPNPRYLIIKRSTTWLSLHTFQRTIHQLHFLCLSFIIQKGMSTNSRDITSSITFQGLMQTFTHTVCPETVSGLVAILRQCHDKK